MSLSYSAGGVMPQPRLELPFESSNVDSITGLAPDLSTIGTYAATSGGTITTVGANRVHSFTTTGTTSITFLVPVTAQVLVVAGGGGGGGTGTTNQTGGGGGAGEFYTSASYSIAAGTYTVTVGAGGSGGVGSTTGASGGTPTNGGDSIFGTINCNGGGRGGSSGVVDNGSSGGSGGGASRAATGGASVKTAAGLGNAGGSSAGVNGATAGGGGGGGAAGAGADAAGGNATRAAGGAGTTNSIRTGSAVTYAEGGAGGSRGGVADGSNGTTNRGDGGGGGDGNAATNGGAGGSGIVVISYVSALYPEPTYVTGIYGQAINFNNTLSAAGADPNSYVTYDVSSFGLSSNSTTMSLWLNSGLTYPTTAGTTPFYVNLQGVSYNGLYTSSATSTISFRKGTSPATTIGSVTAQTSVWQHHCMVFSNVGAIASNTFSSYYVNGSFIGTANNTIQAFTGLNLGCQTSGSNGALCSIDDVRLFNTPLTATQVQSIYAALGVPGRGALVNVVGSANTSLTGTPLFSQLSQAAQSSAVGAFSLRAVNGTTARAVQVRRSSDSATQDFYADRLGNLLTAPVTGIPLQTWLGGATGNVTTWYDQSGQGRNATGTQMTIVQSSNVNQQWAINPTNGGLSMSGGAFLNGTDFTITCTTKRLGTQGNDGVYGYGANASWVSQASVPSTYGNNTRFGLVMPNAGSTDVRFNDSSFSPAFSSNANVLPSTFVGATEPTVYTAVTLTSALQRMYINGTANGIPISTLTQLTANASTGFTIGTVNYYGSFLGEIGELLIFNQALGTQDISTLYSAR